MSGAAGNALGTTIRYLRAAAGNWLAITAKYLRGDTGVRLGTMIKYLRRTTSTAANKSLGTTTKYLVNQNAGAGKNWAKAHVLIYLKAWHELRCIPL
jgi:hypothetical protein